MNMISNGWILGFGLVLLSSPALSGVAGQKLGVCPEAIIFNEEDNAAALMELAVLLSLVDKETVRVVTMKAGDLDSILWQCGLSIEFHHCTDALEQLKQAIDPTATIGGAAAGYILFGGKDGASSGALIGNVLDKAKDATELALCRRELVEVLEPSAKKIFTGTTFEVEQVREGDVVSQVRNSARLGTVSAREAMQLEQYLEQRATRMKELWHP